METGVNSFTPNTIFIIGQILITLIFWRKILDSLARGPIYSRKEQTYSVMLTFSLLEDSKSSKILTLAFESLNKV